MEATRIEEALAIINELITAAREFESEEDEVERERVKTEKQPGDKIRKLWDDTLAMKAKDFAKMIGISYPTLNRWETKHFLPDAGDIEKWPELLGLARKTDVETPNQDRPKYPKPKIADRPVGIFSLEDVHERYAHAKEVWVIKCLSRFKGSQPGFSRKRQEKLLCRKQGPHFSLVCWVPPKDDDYRSPTAEEIENEDELPDSSERRIAKKSSLEFLRHLKSRTGFQAERFHIFHIKKDEEAFRIGLGYGPNSKIVVVYPPEFENEHGYSVDIFEEMPVAEYRYENRDDIPFESTDCWVQLSLEVSEKLWRRHWRPMVRKLKAEVNAKSTKKRVYEITGHGGSYD